MRLLLLILLLFGGVFGLIRYVQARPIERPPGVLVARAPLQAPLTPESEVRLEKPGYQFKPVAYFEIEARVLAKRLYRYDAASAISPVDLALGWGRMSDTDVLRKLKIWQADRFYFYAWFREPPIPLGEIIASSANMHLIPGNPNIELRLKRLKPGHLVWIKGYLVHVTGPRGFSWRTSTVRTDTGNGACEIVWVADLIVR
ncbi:hypothetical protein [Meiothermus taiwanensis]|uniref:Uncharacterized protein n=2 Tax=Meiothermus taiwanensis TaxID=172827 RepID=A0A399E0T6_9DEIN|nr:hypothetical protein [Meiothermus taiwanensis]AWR85798.1 hypothetical protein Mtai_v1c05510 [Meiothermus taiwanensis WR-220]KIQ54820.1 hypothetical protein SY28_06740 [Meiothermus taiwanensis]KZK16119.1 hypothetical protein A3962_07760 [Meiothermus taiwanensis]RIH77123.1 hypothetical protein Mcate_01486 [Meiothermus taiwanensis]